MKQINLETKISLFTKTILSDYNNFLIYELYMPIIGSDGASLYVTLANKAKQGKKEISCNYLTSTMCISLNDLVNAKKKLEAVGLIQTFVKSESVNRDLIIVLSSPKSPQKFFGDIVLKGLLKQRIGTKNAAELKDFFKMETFDHQSYEEETANLVDVFSINFDSHDFSYDPNTHEVLVDFRTSNSVLKFDFAYFIKNFAKRFNCDENIFSKEEKQAISSLANLYGYNEDFMIEVVCDCYDTIDHVLDLKKLKRACYNSQVVNKVVAKKTKKSVEISSDTKMAKKVKYMEEYTPFNYLKLKQGNTNPVQADMNILSYLATNLGLANGVINALVDYVLETNENRLSKNLIEKIGASIVRERLETAFDTMNYLYNSNKKPEKTEVKPLETEMIAEQKSDDTDDIWQKLKEIDSDE